MKAQQGVQCGRLVGRLLASDIALVAVVIFIIIVAAGIVDDIGHEEQVFCLGHQPVVGGQDGESKKVEHTQEGRAIWSVLLETQDDMCALQLFLCIFQQCDQTFTGAFREDARRNLNVETLTIHQDGLPHNLYPSHWGHLEAQVHGTAAIIGLPLFGEGEPVKGSSEYHCRVLAAARRW